MAMATFKVVKKGVGTLFLTRNQSYFVRKDVWTPDNVVKSYFKDITIPSSTITEHVWQNIEKWADKTALVCGVTNKSYTYHQLYKYSRVFGANLRAKFKINDGDVVCIMMPNSPEYVTALLGSLEAGAEITTVNPIYTAHELQGQLVLSNPKVIIGSFETVKVIKEAFQLTKKELPIIMVTNPGQALPDNTISFTELSQEENVDLSVLKEVRRKSEDTALLPYSSGTTGLPKGVELTNRNIVVNCIQQDVEGIKHYQDTSASHQDSLIAVLPFYHIYGMVIVALHKLSIGAKLVTVPRFHPTTFLSALKDHRINLIHIVPPIMLFIASHPSVSKEHLESVDKVFTGAAPLPREDIYRSLEKMKPHTDVIQLYGLTETSPLVTSMTPGASNYAAVGYAVSNTELKVVDSDGNALGPNEAGELLIRGPQVMKGYKNNPDATKACMTEDGWFKSGDLGFLDKDGIFTIADRLKELIKVKGYQVPPAELENLLKAHPSVLDAAVVGIPDARTIEAPKAFIVVKEGHKADEQSIKEFVKERVAEFKRIKEVQFMESLPRNPSGKLLRRILREMSC